MFTCVLLYKLTYYNLLVPSTFLVFMEPALRQRLANVELPQM